MDKMLLKNTHEYIKNVYTEISRKIIKIERTEVD